MIITLVLNKDAFYQRAPFPILWRQAREALARSRRLVVIGYSLPPTDFAFRRLLHEAFEDDSLEELVIVNPDSGVVTRVKNLVHYRARVLLHLP